jgi:hypothetical protein
MALLPTKVAKNTDFISISIGIAAIGDPWQYGLLVWGISRKIGGTQHAGSAYVAVSRFFSHQ